MKLLVLLALSLGCFQGDESNQAEMLSKAAEAGDLASAQRLLEAGVNPNVLDERGLSPLYYAVSGKSVDLLQLLLAHHADPNMSLAGELPIFP